MLVNSFKQTPYKNTQKQPGFGLSAAFLDDAAMKAFYASENPFAIFFTDRMRFLNQANRLFKGAKARELFEIEGLDFKKGFKYLHNKGIRGESVITTKVITGIRRRVKKIQDTFKRAFNNKVSR